MHSSIYRLKTMGSLMTINNIVVIFAINCACAFLKTVYHLAVVESSYEFFFSELLGYIKVMNILGYSLAFSYLILSRGPGSKMSLVRIAMIGLLAFAVSFPLIYSTDTWNESSLHPILQVTIYSMSTLIFSAWAIMVIVYIQSRESQPKFQLLKQEIAEHSLERERVEMELHLLQAQIEPHFFYNTLANLHSLIDLNPEKAKNLLEELTEYLRSTVHQYRHKFIKLEEEQEMIIRYLNIQKIRFSSKLEYEIDIPKSILNRPILPMSILTLVENAIKHAIEKNNGKGKLVISVKLGPKQMIQVAVTDNIGSLKNDSYGTGITNLLERMKVTYGNRGKFSINCKTNAFTTAHLEVPSNG